VDQDDRVPLYFYSSTSGLTRRFAERLAERSRRPVRDLADPAVRRGEALGPWVLLTPSYKAGNDAHVTLPAAVRSFLRLDANRRRLVGIIGSGNRNFGRHYQAAARELARVSGRPILFEFELSGTPEDVDDCGQVLDQLDRALRRADGR
jgi:protein involved in ribonucleotide reduction